MPDSWHHTGPDTVRVAAVIKGLGPGGAERLLVETARHARPAGVEMAVFYLLATKNHLAPALRAAGVDVRSARVRSLMDLRWLLRLLRALRALRPDVVHIHSPALAAFIRLAARSALLGHPRPAIVTTEHNAWRTYHPLTRWTNAVTCWMDDATIAVSEEARVSVRPARARAEVRTLRHGIDLEGVRAHAADRSRVRAELGIGDDEVVVVTVANYRAQKNYPMLLRAAAATLAECPGARFVAVGQGPLATQIERDHAALALQDRFVLTGYRADATAVIAAGDVFALASDYEGLPVALMEAVALGLPVVATRVGGVAETVGPDAGLLVPPGDVQAFAAALSHLIRERDVRARLQDGARRLGNTFDARTTAGHLAAVYREVRPRPGP